MFKTILALQTVRRRWAVDRPTLRGGITDPVQEIKSLVLQQQQRQPLPKGIMEGFEYHSN